MVSSMQVVDKPELVRKPFQKAVLRVIELGSSSFLARKQYTYVHCMAQNTQHQTTYLRITKGLKKVFTVFSLSFVFVKTNAKGLKLKENILQSRLFKFFPAENSLQVSFNLIVVAQKQPTTKGAYSNYVDKTRQLGGT